MALALRLAVALLVGAASFVTLGPSASSRPVHWGIAAIAVVASPVVVIVLLWLDVRGDRSPRNEVKLLARDERWGFSWLGLTMAAAALSGAACGRALARLGRGEPFVTADVALIALAIGVLIGLYYGRSLAGVAAGDT